jgi:hypothetical protein
VEKRTEIAARRRRADHALTIVGREENIALTMRRGGSGDVTSGGRRMNRIFGGGRYANVTATMALVVALGGTSYAAIKLPANSVTSKTVKDRSLLSKDFKAGQLPAGKTGPAGPAGPQGAAGPQGFTGPPGVTAAVYKATESGPTVEAGDLTVDSITLPGGGNWVVTAKFIANNASGVDGRLSCSLQIGGAPKDSLGAGSTDFGIGASAHTLTGAGAGSTAAIVCNTTAASGSYDAISLTALRVSTIS